MVIQENPDSTESSPSGRHVGHYKTAAGDTDLAPLHTMMISIGLINGMSLTQRKKCVDIMIENQ